MAHHAGHMSLLMIYEQFQPTRTHVSTLDDYDLFNIAPHGDDIQGFDAR